MLGFFNRRGFIGLMLTVALGVAIGAAAVVVTREIRKDSPRPFEEVKKPFRPDELDAAYKAYQRALKAYMQAVGLGRKNLQKYADNLAAAKQRLEIEIFKSTPGVAEMDMTEFEKAAQNASQAQLGQ